MSAKSFKQNRESEKFQPRIKSVGGTTVRKEEPYESKYPRATFYVSKNDVYKLEELVLALKRKGRQTDKSALVREAIKKLFEEYEGEI